MDPSDFSPIGNSVKKMTIGVVVTNYNSWNIALRCVDAHLRVAGHAIERIILVDDHSDRQLDRPLHPKVTVIRNDRNLGFVKSVNVGFKNLGSDIVMLFDADAYPLMDYSNAVLTRFRSDCKLGVIGFTTYDSNRKITGSCEGEPSALRLVLGHKLDSWYLKFFVRRPEDRIVYSCAMAVRKAAFDEVAGFDENLDWLDPDTDLCLKLRSRGWEVEHSSEVTAFHEGGGTAQTTSDRVLRFYKNRWYLLKKHGKIKSVFIARNLILLRLRAEYLTLLLLGNLLYRNREIARDKLLGRRRVLEYCRQHYR